jgi:hypothetical protein
MTTDNAEGGGMNVSKLRPDTKGGETDDHSAARGSGVETVVRSCVLAVALTLAGFFGAWLLK